MAMDTAAKRLSVSGTVPLPDGTINQGDRQTLTGVYAGILAAGVAPPDPILTPVPATRRASAMNVACPWRAVLQIPVGSIGQEARQTMTFMYAPLLAAGGSAATPRVQANWGSWRRSWTG